MVNNYNLEDLKPLYGEEVKRNTILIGILDLNLYPSLSLAGVSTGSKTLFCLCCMSGPISVTVYTNKSGYVPGERIIVNAEIENLSNLNIRASHVKLMQVTTYMESRRTQTKKTELVTISRGVIKYGTTIYYEDTVVVVPSVPPSGKVRTGSIDNQYSLELHVDPSFLVSNLEVKIPIVIGTIPFTNIDP